MLRSRILYFLALVGAIMLAIGYEDTQAGFTILYALLLLGGFCGISALLAPRFLTLSEKVSNQAVFKGEEISYTVSVRNRSPFFYPGAVYRFYWEELATPEGDENLGVCEPFKGQVRNYKLKLPYRGVYDIGLESMTVTDMLGLFSRKIESKDNLTLTVFPEQDDSFAASIVSGHRHRETVVSRSPLNEDFTSIADLRKYTPSDSLRKIHWKLSAKRGELIAKNFQSFESNRTILLLDTRKLPLPTKERAEFEDKMISCLAAGIDFCAFNNMPASLIYGSPGVDEVQLSGLEKGYGVYPLLAEIPFQRGDSPLFELRANPGMGSVIAFLSDLDKVGCTSIKELVLNCRSVSVYLFYSQQIPMTREKEKLLESLREYGVDAREVEVGGSRPEQHQSAQEGGAA